MRAIARRSRVDSSARRPDRHRRQDVYERRAIPTTSRRAGRPPAGEQPRWRRDFPIDWPEDDFVARRDFVKFLVLTSCAFVAGQAWIAAEEPLARRTRRTPPPATQIASLSTLPRGAATMFRYPGDARSVPARRTTPTGSSSPTARSARTCRARSCPSSSAGVLRCPCHEG